jgi:hypothetical protein
MKTSNRAEPFMLLVHITNFPSGAIVGCGCPPVS